MRKLVFLFLAVTAAAAVQAQVKVNGTVAGAQGQKLYFVNEEGTWADSVTLSADGKFAFTTPVKPPAEAMYALFLEEGPAVARCL